MDIKEQIGKIVEKLSSDSTLLERFKSDPLKTVEGVLGIKLPQDIAEQVISGVKAKLAGDKISGVAASLKKLF